MTIFDETKWQICNFVQFFCDVKFSFPLQWGISLADALQYFEDKERQGKSTEGNSIEVS